MWQRTNERPERCLAVNQDPFARRERFMFLGLRFSSSSAAALLLASATRPTHSSRASVTRMLSDNVDLPGPFPELCVFDLDACLVCLLWKEHCAASFLYAKQRYERHGEMSCRLCATIS